MDGQRIATRHGERLELFGQISLRELTLVVSGLEVDDPDSEGTINLDAELELDRPEVVRLRDQLTEWLSRGEL